MTTHHTPHTTHHTKLHHIHHITSDHITCNTTHHTIILSLITSVHHIITYHITSFIHNCHQPTLHQIITSFINIKSYTNIATTHHITHICIIMCIQCITSYCHITYIASHHIIIHYINVSHHITYHIHHHIASHHTRKTSAVLCDSTDDDIKQSSSHNNKMYLP